MNGKRLLCGLLCLVLLVGLLPAAFAAQASTEATVTAYKPKVTLTFQTNGGTAIKPIMAERGKTVFLGRYVPLLDGFIFDGWYSDATLTNPITEVVIDKDKTIYAAWRLGTTDNGALFTDVPTDAWYAHDVVYVYNHGIMKGTSATTFSPDADLTRAMMVSILYRAVGSPVVKNDCPFPDVVEGYYAESPITWAYNEGIVLGSEDDGNFYPNEGISREDMAVILYRFAQYCGLDTTQGGMAIREYADFDTISDYAVNALSWAVHVGLINGLKNNTLDPQSRVSRAQAATILHRMNEMIYI